MSLLTWLLIECFTVYSLESAPTLRNIPEDGDVRNVSKDL
jgi:hypothetical protein